VRDLTHDESPLTGGRLRIVDDQCPCLRVDAGGVTRRGLAVRPEDVDDTTRRRLSILPAAAVEPPGPQGDNAPLEPRNEFSEESRAIDASARRWVRANSPAASGSSTISALL